MSKGGALLTRAPARSAQGWEASASDVPECLSEVVGCAMTEAKRSAAAAMPAANPRLSGGALLTRAPARSAQGWEASASDVPECLSEVVGCAMTEAKRSAAAAMPAANPRLSGGALLTTTARYRAGSLCDQHRDAKQARPAQGSDRTRFAWAQPTARHFVAPATPTHRHAMPQQVVHGEFVEPCALTRTNIRLKVAAALGKP